MSAKRRCPACANLEQFCICPLSSVVWTPPPGPAPLGRPTKVPYLRVIDGG